MYKTPLNWSIKKEEIIKILVFDEKKLHEIKQEKLQDYTGDFQLNG